MSKLREHALKCPDCGAPMVLRRSGRVRLASGVSRPFYGCTRFPDCNGTHGAHPDGTPLGVPGNAAVREARKLAHAALDAYRDTAGLSVTATYDKIARDFGGDIHIADLDISGCRGMVAYFEQELKQKLEESHHGNKH